jgi:hypothetical protein
VRDFKDMNMNMTTGGGVHTTVTIMVVTRYSTTSHVAVLSPQMTSLSPPFSHPPFSHGRGRCDRVPWAHALRAFNSVLSTRYARHPRLFAPPISALIATRRSSSYGPLTVLSRSSHGPLTVLSRSSHGPLTVHPAARLLRVWRLQTLHLAASRCISLHLARIGCR